MIGLVVDLPDESFTASSTATDHYPYDARFIDMSVFARQMQESGSTVAPPVILRPFIYRCLGPEN